MKIIRLFSAVFSFLVASNACADTTQIYPLNTTSNTETINVTAAVTQYQGTECVQVIVPPGHKNPEEGGCDNCTFLKLTNTRFHNGTIEIEVMGKPQENAPEWARGFVGIVFRISDDNTKYEGVYIRPKNSQAQDQLQRNHTTQYFSYPDYPWFRLRQEAPGMYESWAAVEVGVWTKMRLNVNDSKAVLFLNDQKEPVLIINDMKHSSGMKGAIGLFTEPETDTCFANLKITHQ